VNLVRDRPHVRPALIVLLFWLIATTVLVVATGLLVWDDRARQLATAENHLDALSVILAEQTTRTFQSVDLILLGVTERFRRESPAGQPLEVESVNQLLGARISGASQVRSLFVVGPDGGVQYSALSSPVGIFLGDRDYVRAHGGRPGTGFFISRPAQNRVDGEWSIFMSRRLEDAGGNYRGVVAASIPLSYFDTLYKSIKLGESSSIALLLSDGLLLYSEPFSEGQAGELLLTGDALRLDGQSQDRSITRAADRAMQLVAVREVDDFPLVTTISVNESNALAAWRGHAEMMVMGVVGVIVLLGIAALAFARELVREENLAKSLGESQARLQGIISSAMDAIVTMDDNGRIVLFNPAAERMFGCAADDALGTRLDRFIPERFRSEHREHIARFDKSGQMARSKESRSEIVALRSDGEEISVDASISQVSTLGKKLYTAVLRDNKLRIEREDELRRSNRQLRELSASLQSVREEERTRIARELHDDLGQQLTGFRMNLSWIGSRLRADNPDLSEKVAGLQRQINMTIASVRRITSELRPLMLDDLGLFAAVGWLTDDVAKKTGLEIELHLDSVEPELDMDTSSALFRILQESLTNVVRHADASCAHVVLEVADTSLILRVEDDGKGMRPADQGKPRSFGLLGIRERAYILGGNVHITSKPGRGTSIEVAVPLQRPVNEGQGT
jgi:PAS domain S-box-containing protein